MVYKFKIPEPTFSPGHYQQSRIILNLCDSLGIMVWEEIPLVPRLAWVAMNIRCRQTDADQYDRTAFTTTRR